MQIWECHFDGLNHYSVLVHVADGLNFRETFTANGQAKQWAVRPKVEPFIEKRKKTAKPRADISYLSAGSLILNQKAFDVLRDFLLPFGQLLELDCQGEIEYFYNVTNLIECIDQSRSEKQDGAIFTEVFLPGAIPDTPQIFKDPQTARISIYINEAGKQQFERLVADAGLLGARFVEAGQGLLG
ncbi:MAG: hypothetical protein RL748_3652 [Pseudomonadota bacterium]|jgi:hypothetical protein